MYWNGFTFVVHASRCLAGVAIKQDGVYLRKTFWAAFVASPVLLRNKKRFARKHDEVQA